MRTQETALNRNVSARLILHHAARRAALAAVLLILDPAVAPAAEVPTSSTTASESKAVVAPSSLTAWIENDLLYNPAPGRHQDRHYTQGLKMMYSDGRPGGPFWARGLGLRAIAEILPDMARRTAATSYGLGFGQNIYTPENDESKVIVPDDRPYGGWLYLAAAIQRRAEPTLHSIAFESYELDLGIIGPEAQGEWAQNSVHQLRQLPTFDGWGNQLETEPGFDIRHGRAWRLTLTPESGRFIDWVPQIGFHLGTVRVSAEMSLTWRIGLNLPDDTGVQTIDAPLLPWASRRPPRQWGAYVFGRMSGTAVGRNVFLDGNAFRSSHQVDKEPLVADLAFGAAAIFGSHCDVSWTLITRTEEFEGQKGFDQFGSLQGRLSWNF